MQCERPDHSPTFKLEFLYFELSPYMGSGFFCEHQHMKLTMNCQYPFIVNYPNTLLWCLSLITLFKSCYSFLYLSHKSMFYLVVFCTQFLKSFWGVYPCSFLPKWFWCSIFNQLNFPQSFAELYCKRMYHIIQKQPTCFWIKGIFL